MARTHWRLSSNWVWLEPTGACTARLTAQHLLTWCKVLGVPDVFVSDTASHFKNHMMVELEKALGVERKFAVANSPWSNGTFERMMREGHLLLSTKTVQSLTLSAAARYVVHPTRPPARHTIIRHKLTISRAVLTESHSTVPLSRLAHEPRSTQTAEQDPGTPGKVGCKKTRHGAAVARDQSVKTIEV